MIESRHHRARKGAPPVERRLWRQLSLDRFANRWTDAIELYATSVRTDDDCFVPGGTPGTRVSGSGVVSRTRWSPAGVPDGTPAAGDWRLSTWDLGTVNQWYRSSVGSAFALLDSPELGGAFMANSGTLDGIPGVHFYPNADGTPNINLTVGSDFAAMRENMCWNLRRRMAALNPSVLTAADYPAPRQDAYATRLCGAPSGGL